MAKDEGDAVASFLEGGLPAWRERALSLRRSSSLSGSHGSPAPSLSETAPLLASPSETAKSSAHLEAEKGSMPRDLPLLLAGKLPEASTADERDYFEALLQAPQAWLIHLIMEYHQSLVAAGEEEKAKSIAASLAAVMQSDGRRVGPEKELHGIELLLKDGLLQFLLRINPYLPNSKNQVICFKDISYKLKRTVPEGFETLGTKAKGIVSGPLKKKPQIADVAVLRGVTGHIMPGSFTLVLGPPGCGKSTLHKVLAGRANLGKGIEFSGRVTYNGRTAAEVKVQRLVGVVDSSDFHLPLLSVKETMEFARDFTQFWTWKNYGPELKDIMREALQMGLDPKLELTTSMTGLKRILNRPAGSPTIPTTTADERHRLSVAEILSGTYPAYFFDELNAGGIDPKVTYEMVLATLIFSRVRGTACLISLQQPNPEVFQLFDRLILLSRGRVAFQGPISDALPYFESLGYVKPANVETAEFLQEVTTQEGCAYLKEGCAHLDADGFAEAFEKSPLHAQILRIVNSPQITREVSARVMPPFDIEVGPGPSVASLGPASTLREVSLTKTAPIEEGDAITGVAAMDSLVEDVVGEPAEKVQKLLDEAKGPITLLTTRPYKEPETIAAAQYENEYLRSVWYEMWRLTCRHVALQWRNKFSLYARTFQIVLLSLYAGSLFFQMSDDVNQLDANLRRGVGFYSLMVNTLVNLGQYPALFEERNVFYKQEAGRFFRPFSYWFGLFAGGALYSLAEATIWSTLVYFLSGLSTDSGGLHFWVFYVLVLLVQLHGAAMVRFVAFFAPDIGVANAISGVFIALFVLFAGFVVSRFKIPKYWIWFYYINPLQWAITDILINEFSSKTWTRSCAEANLALFPQCRGRIEQTLGRAYLASGQFLVDRGWIGVGAGVIIGWIVLWNFLAYLCIAKIRHIPPTEEGALPAKELADRDESAIFRAEDEEYAAEKAAGFRSSIPLVPVTLSWYDLSYSIFIPQIQQKKSVIHDVSGWVRPGEMLALLGISTAEKSTLLDILAERYVNPEEVSGQVLVNGYPRKRATFARIVGFVDRQDAYWPFTTVREALEFSAAMRIGSTVTAEDRRAFVDYILEVTELSHMEKRLVVSLKSTLGQGDAKRVMIAIEMAANPSVLLLEQPTAGIDSQAALHVVKCLKNIAGGGVTIAASLHLPSLRLVAHFDSALILKAGGECVYFGPIGEKCAAIKSYFEGISGTPPCDANMSPMSYVFDIIGDGVSERRVMRRDYAFEYRVSRLAIRNAGTLEALRHNKGGGVGPQLTARGYAAGSLLQAKMVILRLQKQYWRNLHYSFGRFMSAILLGLLVGSIFWQENVTSIPGMNARAGQMFISCLLFAVANAGGVIPQVLGAAAAYRRELSQKQYHAIFYNLSWGLAEIPYLVMITLIFCSISFGMSGLATQSAAIFFKVWFIFFEFVLAVTFFALLLAVAAPFPPLASVLVPMVISIMVPTGGLVLVRLRTPAYYLWLFWINPLQYALNAMTSTTFFCDVNKPQCIDGGRVPACQLLPAACPACDCPRLSNNVFIWSQIQGSRSLDHSRVALDMMALALYSVLFRLLAFLALRYLKHNRTT